MKWTGALLTVAAVALGGASLVHSQDAQKNPLEGNAEAIRAGMGLFRVRCADCHGMDARGVRSPDLTQVWASGRTDEGLFKILRNGIPGTEMPPVARAADEDLWKILAYLKTLAAPTSMPVASGDVMAPGSVHAAAVIAAATTNILRDMVVPRSLTWLVRAGAGLTRAPRDHRFHGCVRVVRSVQRRAERVSPLRHGCGSPSTGAGWGSWRCQSLFPWWRST